MKVEAVGLLPESCSLLISQLGMIRDGCNLFAGTSKHLVISDNFTSPSARKMIFDCGNHHRHRNFSPHAPARSAWGAVLRRPPHLKLNTTSSNDRNQNRAH